MRSYLAIASCILVACGIAATVRGAEPYENNAMTPLYHGGIVTGLEGLKPYTGENACKMLVGPERQNAYRLNYRQLRANYGESVDFQLRREQVILCPQTAEFVYTRFTPTTVRYQRGSRPRLEAVVDRVTTGCRKNREKMLALMRFCRDLYKKREGRPFTDYVYGGTEEQLIDKGEELCECLGRLMVGLCEIAGMPGRIVMHDIGGHITAEILVDGHWAFVDPRLGLYCLKPDGSLASVWEIWQHPEWLDQQPEHVRADLSPKWTWEERVWKCRTHYYHPNEVTGFENYSLADAPKYSYTQKTYQQATDDGLWAVNKQYLQAINEVFGLAGDGYRYDWRHTPLRRLPIAYRHDGFSMFFDHKPPMTRRQLEQTYLDPFAGSNAEILVWGLGPGSVFCFDTKVGQICGQPLDEAQWKLVRRGDRNVYENVMGLIRSGNDPLRVAVERGHPIGRKIFARLEMNHEYGPADPTNWKWIVLVGDFNKQHPEFRIPGSVLLDFKHKEVRDFKLAILREAAAAGVDGIAMDFAIYPPYFEKPDPEIMTQFVRDVRTMLDELGRKQNRRIELMARVETPNALKQGLDWPAWMRERLIDYIVPTNTDLFDIDVGEFVSMGHRTGVKVVPTLWQALGLVDTDPQPSDEASGRRRYTKPKTQGMFFAQAMLMHREGVDGLQLGFSAHEWTGMPFLNDLADPVKVEFADKHYMVNIKPHCPVVFAPPEDAATAVVEKTVSLRIGDDVPKALATGRMAKASLVLYGDPLGPGEELEIHVNNHGPAVVTPDATAGDASKADPNGEKPSIFDANWWRRGERDVPIPAEWLLLGNNIIRVTHTRGSAKRTNPFSITWIDLLIDYQQM